MNEFELIQQCFADWSVQHPQVLQGIGDDCLVWLDPEPLVISTDTAVVGRHFPEFSTPEQVAMRAFLPALSDLAAMTAKPAFFTLALTLPEGLDQAWTIAFAKQLRTLAETHQIMLAGGDTTSGERLTVTINVHGTCPHPVLRSGAKPDDDVWVTGHLGQAAAGLSYVLDKQEALAPNPAWVQAYWQPQLPMTLASQLQGCIHSAIDLSDGLLGDAMHIAKRSDVEMTLQVDKLPLDGPLKALGEAGLKFAVSGGDDYQLLFTAAPMVHKEIQHLAKTCATQVTCIGKVKEGKPAVRWYDGDHELTLPWQSFTHF
jgi:thiamine-monophosphate kinase